MLYCGWFIRQIIVRFQDGWNGIIDESGNIVEKALVDSTHGLLQRMEALLEDAAFVDKWCGDYGFIPGSHSAQKVYRKTATRKRPAGKKLESVYRSVANNSRIWTYQELVLLRAELWCRYHLRHDQLLGRYQQHKLYWQSCWFQAHLTPPTISSQISQFIRDTHRVSHVVSAKSPLRDEEA
jgi:hypothetical protein